MIRLIASDIDGTLLQGGERALSEELFGLIRQLHDKGIRFIPASGRQYLNLRSLFAPVADELIYLCENGALVMEQDRLLSKTALERDAGLELIRQIEGFGPLEALVSGERTCYVSTRRPDYVEHIRYFVGNHTTALENLSEIAEPFLKISAWCPDGVTPEIERFFESRWADRFSIAVAGECWLDFTLANKGTGLRAVAERLGVAPGEIAAFGDNFNDLPMMRFAGVSYAMEGAAPGVKAQATHTCRRVEEVLKSFL